MDWDRTWVPVADRSRARTRAASHDCGDFRLTTARISFCARPGPQFLRNSPIENCSGARRRGKLPRKVRDQDIRDFVETIADFPSTHRKGDFHALVVFATAPLLRQISWAMPTGLRSITVAAVPTESSLRLGLDWWRTFKLPGAVLH